ncbi:hypothetical protein RJ639_039751 [Escallonia herrerae]|uniref:G domain-containing protein n=1 Tax=Escallonia herrerae TaxID=1293975 RepID=A0AA88WLF4_9ASTE|nr:hypothetical protein RJ639_039751 [Escallonia herrerae]
MGSFRAECLSQTQIGSVNAENGSTAGEYDKVGCAIGFGDLDSEANRRRAHRAYDEVLRSYDELQLRSQSLEEAKSKILGYIPGAWTEKVDGLKLRDYIVPKTISLLLVGPKGCGKSSLVNRISRVFEDEEFTPERAQCLNPKPDNSAVGDGTYFVQEYMIPRGSKSFCLYDTRSLSDDVPENVQLLKRWMTKGVRHGELAIMKSDSAILKSRMKCKARQDDYSTSETRMVNFVIFVVNGLSVLKSMESNDEADKMYTEMIATMFNCPFLSFKESRDPATELTIVDMLRFSLEHADRHLPGKGWFVGKVLRASPPACLTLLICLCIVIASAHVHHARSYFAPRPRRPQPGIHIDWHAIRHLWLGSEYD